MVSSTKNMENPEPTPTPPTPPVAETPPAAKTEEPPKAAETLKVENVAPATAEAAEHPDFPSANTLLIRTHGVSVST